MAARVINLALLFLLGALFGVLGTVAQQSTASIAGVAVPWGSGVSLLGIACLLAGIRLVDPARLPALVTAAGVLVPILVFSFQSQGGSVLIPDNALGRVWIFAPVVIAMIVVGWPRSLPRRADA